MNNQAFIDAQVELESKMYDAGYAAGQASIHARHLQLRRDYIEGITRLLDRALADNAWDYVVYLRQLLRIFR